MESTRTCSSDCRPDGSVRLECDVLTLSTWGVLFITALMKASQAETLGRMPSPLTASGEAPVGSPAAVAAAGRAEAGVCPSAGSAASSSLLLSARSLANFARAVWAALRALIGRGRPGAAAPAAAVAGLCRCARSCVAAWLADAGLAVLLRAAAATAGGAEMHPPCCRLSAAAAADASAGAPAAAAPASA